MKPNCIHNYVIRGIDGIRTLNVKSHYNNEILSQRVREIFENFE